MRVWYIDSTLRDGEQAPGVSFHPSEKINIATLLDEIGIHEAEIGTPAMGKSEIKIMHDIATAGFNFKTLSWCRATEADIRAAIKTRTDGINLSFPVSEIQMQALGKNENWVYSRLPRLISIAKNSFEYVAIGLQDASRANHKFLENIINLAVNFSADRIRLADTVGCLNPITTQQLFSPLTKKFPDVNFEFHGHNDLGMATANSLAALMGGASSISTTVNGLGERAGNTPLDEIVFALRYSSHIEPEINTKKILCLSEYVAYASGRPIPASKPITGEKVFMHESGIHTNSLIKNKKSYQLINEQETGRDIELNIVFGKHSGSAALIEFLRQKGLKITQKNASSLLEMIKMQSELRKDNLPDEDIMQLFYQLT